TNGDAIRKIYDQLSQEHGKLGTRPNMTYEQLSDMITKQSEVVRSRYNVAQVGFRVETVDGKVKLKAKPIQE
ncbi:MAG TPA: MXAN_5187 C-terminal domain-containing protein, partial [Thermoanaerobaculia bacterium]